MGSLSPGFGLEALDGTITALNASITAMQAQFAAMQAQLTAAQAFVSSTPDRLTTSTLITNWDTITESGWYRSDPGAIGAPNSTDFFYGHADIWNAVIGSTFVSSYSGGDTSSLTTASFRRDRNTNWGPWYSHQLSRDENDARYAVLEPAVRSALMQPTLADVRSALGLGSAALANNADFEPAGAVLNSTDVEERALDAVAAALTVEMSLIYGRAGAVDAQFSAGMAWQLRTGNALVQSGAAGVIPPATGLSWIHDDTGNRITLRSTEFWNDPNAVGVGGETGGQGTP